MSGTLAEAKTELGHLITVRKQHIDGCQRCQVVRKPKLRCDDRLKLEAEIKDLAHDIANWLTPPPGSLVLFHWSADD